MEEIGLILISSTTTEIDMSGEDAYMAKHEFDMVMAAVMAEKMLPNRWLCKFGGIYPTCQKVRNTSTWRAYRAMKKSKQEQLDERMAKLNAQSDYA